MAKRQHDCYQDHDHPDQFEASSCDHQFIEQQQVEIAALKTDLRAVSLFLSGLDDHERPELCASCRY